MSIKLEQYKIFNECCATLSFSVAARNLYISQSAVSQTINTLEKELDTQLFIRQPRGVTLTNEGRILYEEISNALSIITNVENQLTKYQELKDGILTIGAGDTVCIHFVKDILVKYKQLYPNVKVNVVNRTSIELIDLLKSGQVDIGFLNLPIEEESLTVVDCLTIHDIFVTTRQLEKPVDYDYIEKHPLLMLEEISNSRRYVDNFFAKKSILLQPTMELGAHEILLEFASSNLGISCVIKEFSKNYLNDRLYEVPLKEPIPSRTIGYSYLKRRTLSMAALKFIELINE